MSDLTAVFPQPEPATLGGEMVQVIQFRLGDLARLQGIARDLKGHPLAGRRLALSAAKAACPDGDYLGDSAEAHSYAALLREAIRGAKSYLPPLAGEEASRLMATDAGLVLWLDVLLSRINPGFTATTAAGLLPAMTGEEYLHLTAIAYANHPLDELLRLAEPGVPERRKPFDWGKAIVEFCNERGWTPEAVERMYLSQWWLWRSGGKLIPGEIKGDRARRRAVEGRVLRLMRGPTGSNGTGG